MLTYATTGHRNVCIFLLEEAGADLLIVDALGRNAADLAME
jgi:hypothetical protein